jgi:NAD+ synthase
MLHLYYYAERYKYFVCGTTNKYDRIQGFSVKYGEGGVDVEPLAHLFKSQAYATAAHLKVSEAIIQRQPSPDTDSFQVSDKEFYFRMPYDVLGTILCAWEIDFSV